MTKIKNTYALILGGSSGMGLASAYKLASEGYHICIVHRDRKSYLSKFQEDITALKSYGVTVITYNMDALKTETITTVLNELQDQSISIIIHSIAKGSLQPLLAKNATLSKEALDITLHGMATSWWIWVKALIAKNKLTNDVRNIAFTSEGNTKVWSGYGAVSVAKAALEALMRQMAIELAPLGIKTNCIQAGVTQTPSFTMIPNNDLIAENSKKRNPFKRITTPQDVANAVYLLSMPEAIWINGTLLKVDGGESLR